jgi:hypothetical protein
LTSGAAARTSLPAMKPDDPKIITDEEDYDEELEGKQLETSPVQKFLSPLYIIILIAFLITACIPLWMLLSMVLIRLHPSYQ